VARPTKKSPSSKGRPAAVRAPAKPAKPVRSAAAKRTSKPAKKAPAKTVRAKAPAPKSKPAKKTKAKPPAKPAGRPAPKAVKAAPKAKAAKAVGTPKPPVAKPAPVAKPVTPPKPAVVAKPAPPPKPEPPKKPRKPELTPKEIAGVRAALVEQRAVFMREALDLDEAANISQSEMSGEVSFDEEYADAGSFTFEREKELSIGNNIRDLLDKVNHAINAIDRGTYGICENCGNPIAKARLLALPYSTLCLNCKQIDERTR
jgi:RNA polymerase-binding protein DksA